MNHTTLSTGLARLLSRAARSTRFLALAIIAAFTSLALQPAQAQSSDTWKSVAIIGGSTAAGAYIGHKMAGGTGAMIGAGLGATVGYEIDSRRRANEYSQYGYNDPYGNGGYYGSNGGYYGNDGYYGGPNDGGYYPYPSGYQSNGFRSSGHSSHRH
jgi:hypothetical protein